MTYMSDKHAVYYELRAGHPAPTANPYKNLNEMGNHVKMACFLNELRKRLSPTHRGISQDPAGNPRSHREARPIQEEYGQRQQGEAAILEYLRAFRQAAPALDLIAVSQIRRDDLL